MPADDVSTYIPTIICWSSIEGPRLSRCWVLGEQFRTRRWIPRGRPDRKSSSGTRLSGITAFTFALYTSCIFSLDDHELLRWTLHSAPVKSYLLFLYDHTSVQACLHSKEVAFVTCFPHPPVVACCSIYVALAVPYCWTAPDSLQRFKLSRITVTLKCAG